MQTSSIKYQHVTLGIIPPQLPHLRVPFGRPASGSLFVTVAKRLTPLVIGYCLLVGLLGCEKGKRLDLQLMTRPAVSQDNCQSGDELEFIECMDRQTACSFAHAVRAVAMFINDGKDAGTTFEDRYDYLLERGVVRPAWDLDADHWIDRGTLSFMLYKVIGLKGGVNMWLFASWGLGDRRYAYRELRYRNLVQAGVDYNYISGPELITTLGNVDQYMRASGRYTPGEEIQLGEKPHLPTTAP